MVLPTGHKLTFEIGEFVYVNTDPHQEVRLITGITLRPSGVFYILSCNGNERDHLEIEMGVYR
jgi:hypothetical protein